MDVGGKMTIPSIPDLLRLMEENQAQAALIEKLGEALKYANRDMVDYDQAYLDEALAAYEEWKKGTKP